MQSHVVIHPGFHRSKGEPVSDEVEEFEQGIAERLRDKGSNIVLLCDPRNIDDAFYQVVEEERVFITDPGQGKLWDPEDSGRLSEILKGTTSFLVHGCYMENCVYDIATKLHDALLRESYEGLAADTMGIWTPLGRFEDAEVSFGKVLKGSPATAPLDESVFPFMGIDTFIYSTS